MLHRKRSGHGGVSRRVVTAAVIRRGDAVLIAKRKAGGELSGKWEFPGGKVEPGEDERSCLARELREELAIETVIGAFIADADFEHGGRPYRLHAYEVEWTAGKMELREHDDVRWVTPAEMRSFDMADSDRIIASVLSDLLSGGQVE